MIRILIVDDDPVSQIILKSLLEPWGECTTLMDGQEALRNIHICLQHQNPFDLICLDIMMPEMNGHQTLAEIRKTEKKLNIAPEKRSRIIMTTALADGNNVIEAFGKECNAYLIKPVTKKDLYKELESLGFSPPEHNRP